MKISDFPILFSEFHLTKNNNIRLKDFLSGSHKKVWWKCDKANDHVWISEIRSRTKRNNGCPYCSGKKPSSTNNLMLKYPQIAEQWHPTKNGILKPENFTQGSGKYAWFKCPKGYDHEYKA